MVEEVDKVEVEEAEAEVPKVPFHAETGRDQVLSTRYKWKAAKHDLCYSQRCNCTTCSEEF